MNRVRTLVMVVAVILVAFAVSVDRVPALEKSKNEKCFADANKRCWDYYDLGDINYGQPMENGCFVNRGGDGCPEIKDCVICDGQGASSYPVRLCLWSKTLQYGCNEKATLTCGKKKIAPTCVFVVDQCKCDTPNAILPLSPENCTVSSCNGQVQP